VVEAENLRSLQGLGVAPRLLSVVEHEGRIGLVEERLAGPSMLTQLQRRPWRYHHLARVLADTHRAVHRVPAVAELPEIRHVLASRIREAALPRRLFDFVSRVLDRLPDGEWLCHGDYHPGNVLLATGRVAVIDWGAATRGAPEADHARTLLLLRSAEPAPGTPPLSRALIASGRRLLAAAYARAYQRASPHLRDVASWEVVHIAARLSESNPAERNILIRGLETSAMRDQW
jgi:aminoglycoside phosphotransferase (APT) family kinase protein